MFLPRVLTIFLNDLKWRLLHGEDTWTVLLDGRDMTILKNNRRVAAIDLGLAVRIKAYRKDLLTHAPVCISVESKTSILKAHEFFVGFVAFAEELQHQFPSINPNWLRLVDSGDAFSANETTLWEVESLSGRN